MKNNKNSVIHLSIFIAVLGIGILGIIKVIGSRYMNDSRIESSVLNSVIDLVDRSLKKEGSCIVTLSQVDVGHKPQSVNSILSSNRFAEFQVGRKLTSNFNFKQITLQLIDETETEDLVVLKLVFENTKSLEQRSVLKLFSLKKDGTKFVSCRQIQEIRR